MKITKQEISTVLKNDYMEVQKGVVEHFLSVRWLQHPSSMQLRHNYYLLADLLLVYECRLLLNDMRNVLYLELADQHWLMQQLIPLLVSTPLEAQACIVSQVSLELMDTERMLDHFASQGRLQHKTINTRLFLDAAHAREWLFLN